jgi:ABC-type transport system substrate-binding protein/DNA-binding SARP family transcriptional activator/streptogramin lyase
MGFSFLSAAATRVGASQGASYAWPVRALLSRRREASAAAVDDRLTSVDRPLEFRILGPLEVAGDDGPLDLPAGKPRALLAVLLLHQGEVVSVDRLVDELWGEAPPPTAAKNVQGYVARLRRVLGNGTLLTQAPGYALRVEALDAARFQTLVEEARHEEPAAAAPRLEEALALWRGPPLADFAYEAFAQDEIVRLEELRLSALEDRIEAALALGRHEEVVAEVESLAREHPLRERLQGLRLIALYGCGRQAEALDAYRTTRRRLVEELGVEPGPELKELERRILEQDPSLEAPRAKGRPVAAVRKLRRRGRVIAFAGLFAAGGLAAILAVALSGKEAHALAAAPNSVGVVDGRHDQVRMVIRAGGEPGGIAAGQGAVWVTDTASDLLLRISANGRSVDRIPVGHRPTGVAVGDGQVWVVNQLDRTVSEVNPQALRVVRPIQVGNGASAIAFGHGSVWVANATDYSLSRINTDSGHVTTIPLAGEPGGIAASRQGVWVSSASTGQLVLVDARTNTVSQSVPIGNGPQGVAVGGRAVWVANTPDGTVSRFEPGTGRIRKIAVGEAPTGVAYGDGTVWVAGRSGNVLRIDPASDSVRSVLVGNEPTGVTTLGTDAWVTVLPGSLSHRGGTLRLALPADLVPYSPDPTQFAGIPQWQLLSLTNDGLVTYRRAGGLAGAKVVPDLATAIPQPTGGGRNYTFRLREGIRYSNSAVVQPEDIRRGIERTMRSDNPYLTSQYAGIVGAERCSPHACDLHRGVVVDREARTVTFHLVRPDSDFLYKLSFAMASAVPAGTFRGKALPATGPYMTASFTPSRSWVLVRNPEFHEWSSDAQPGGFPDRIVLKAAPANQVAALAHGAADALLAPPLGGVDALARRYASQVHIDPAGATFALGMNTRVAPFYRVAVRKALNYAIDRNRIARLTGSSLTAQSTCQVLAPTLPGYRPYCPYTLDPSPSGSWTAPDFAKAERLVTGSGTSGTKVTLLITPPSSGAPTLQIGRYVVSVLDRLGYRASLRVITNAASAGLGDLGDSSKRPQIGWFTWFQDYPTPSNFIEPLLTCRSFVPRSQDNANVAEFCNRQIDAQIARAAPLQARDPAAAGELWSRIDHELVDQAPWVPLYNPRTVTVLGPRVGNYKYHPFWNVLLDQLWVR